MTVKEIKEENKKLKEENEIMFECIDNITNILNSNINSIDLEIHKLFIKALIPVVNFEMEKMLKEVLKNG